MLMEFAMEAEITNDCLCVDQHDTGTANTDSLSRQIVSLQQLVEKLTSTIQKMTEAFQNQTKTIEEQKDKISKLLDSLQKAEYDLSENKELVKTLKKLLSSKDVDLDALRRLVFYKAAGNKRRTRKTPQIKLPKKSKNSIT